MTHQTIVNHSAVDTPRRKRTWRFHFVKKERAKRTRTSRKKETFMAEWYLAMSVADGRVSHP